MTVHFTSFERTPSKSKIIAEDSFDKELFFDGPGKTGVKSVFAGLLPWNTPERLSLECYLFTNYLN
ncbi:hypothetical protein QUB56_01610 [Microcoleus sp. AR_TQ3_B6]|uniref:hypothetical protein n=1 Tax=Microcoleus sp. AR_TQ3_B6 TaxID=3055284 RepID=UPI002FD5AD72